MTGGGRGSAQGGRHGSGRHGHNGKGHRHHNRFAFGGDGWAYDYYPYETNVSCGIRRVLVNNQWVNRRYCWRTY